MATTTVPPALVDSLPASKITGSLPVIQVSTGVVTATTTAGLSVPDSAWTTVPFPTEALDNEGAFTAASGVYTCAIAGLYRIDAQVECSNFPTANTRTAKLAIYKNAGQEAIASLSGDCDPSSLRVSALVQLAVGNTVEVKVYHNEGVSKTLSTTAASNRIDITRVSA